MQGTQPSSTSFPFVSSAPARDRVADHTAETVNREIRNEAARRVDALRGDPARVRVRLAELDAEWDVERALETLSSGLTLAGLGAGLAARRPGWLGLPVLVQAFFLQHALQGWCPPLPILRRLGFRTPREIEAERCALLALLGETPHPRKTPVRVETQPASGLPS